MITVAPQKDICPHGRTYPKKAAPIEHSRIIIPDNQTVGIFLVDSKYSPREMWVNITIKNNDAPFMCIYRIIHPCSMSRMMCITDSKAIVILGI